MEGKDLYAVHVNFGDEELESEVRTMVALSSELSPILEWIGSCRSTFTMQQLENNSHKSQTKSLRQLLQVLLSVGLVSLVS
jgi:hypothetical protein